MDQDPGNRTWWIPFVLPLALVAVVVGAIALPAWIFAAAGAVVLLLGVPFVLRRYFDAGELPQLPDWLPGGRPGNR